MVQAFKSSTSFSASAILPKLVRSPHKARTSASSEIRANMSANRPSQVSLTWRSPIAARMIGAALMVFGPFMLLVHALADDIGEAPFGDVDDIVGRADQPAAADL